MSGPESDDKAPKRPGGNLPITEELANLKQAADILRCVEELGKHGDFEDDTSMIVDVIKAARRLILEVIEALRAYFASQGGAT